MTPGGQWMREGLQQKLTHSELTTMRSDTNLNAKAKIHNPTFYDYWFILFFVIAFDNRQPLDSKVCN